MPQFTAAAQQWRVLQKKKLILYHEKHLININDSIADISLFALNIFHILKCAKLYICF